MNVLIADKYEADGIEALRNLGCRISQDADLSGESLALALASNGCEILVVRSTQVTAEIMDNAKSLKLIIRAGAGYDTVDTRAARQRGIAVANCPGTNSAAVAELAMGLILALDRRIVHNVNDLRRGVWNKKEYSKARGLKGRTLGIVGLGQIGVLIARRAKAFDMQLIYSDVIQNTPAEQELGISKVDFETLLAKSDFVSLHVPLTDQTRAMFNDAVFSRMKPTAFLINCSRGEVVDSAALVRAVESGAIAGAGLDVYQNEPGPSDKVFADPIAKSQRIYGTHHIGASTEQAQLAVAEEVTRIVDHYRQTGEILHCVNP